MERESKWVPNFSVSGALSPTQVVDRLNRLDAFNHPVTKSRLTSPNDFSVTLSGDNSTCAFPKNHMSLYSIRKKRSLTKSMQPEYLTPIGKSSRIMDDKESLMERVNTAPAAFSYDRVDSLAGSFSQSNNIGMWNDGSGVVHSNGNVTSSKNMKSPPTSSKSSFMETPLEQQLPNIYSESPSRPTSSANSRKLFGSIGSDLQIKVEKLIKQEFLINGNKVSKRYEKGKADENDDISLSSPVSVVRSKSQSVSERSNMSLAKQRRQLSASSSIVATSPLQVQVEHSSNARAKTSERVEYGDIRSELSSLTLEVSDVNPEADISAAGSRPSLAGFSKDFLGCSAAKSVAQSVTQSKLGSPRVVCDRSHFPMDDEGSIATMVADRHLSTCVAIIRGRHLTGGVKSKQERPLENCEKKLFGWYIYMALFLRLFCMFNPSYLCIVVLMVSIGN